MNRQIIGMRGVYAVATELCARGYIVATTSREAKGVDLFLSSEDGQTSFTVQVKATVSESFWNVGDEPIPDSPSYVYAFVRFFDRHTPPGTEFYLVPSADVDRLRRAVKQKLKTDVRRTALQRKDYRNNWGIFSLKR